MYSTSRKVKRSARHYSALRTPSTRERSGEKWVWPQNHESKSLEGYTENTLYLCMLREEPLRSKDVPGGSRKLPMSHGSKTSHTPSPQMSGQEQGKLPFVLLSTSSSLKVSCCTPAKPLAETVIQEESRLLKQAEISATAVLPHIWTPFSHLFFHSSLKVPWQVSSLCLVLQLLPHNTWTAEPSQQNENNA